MNRKLIFDAMRRLLGRSFSKSEVTELDQAIDAALVDAQEECPAEHALGEAGTALIRKWEGCAKRRDDGSFEAYPDPGSADGRPWTIGWGSTGPDVAPGTVWTQEQCDARFGRDVLRYVSAVARAIGDAATSPGQFDALVSFHYNTGAIARATLTKLHRQGRFAEAQQQFGKWIFNDGKPMKGLIRRRAEEAALYGAE